MKTMKRTLILLFLFLFISLFAQTQENSRLDSLLDLTTKYNGPKLVDVFIEIAELQGATNAEQAHQSADEAILLATQIEYPKGIGKAYLVKGTICNFSNRPIKGALHFEEAKKIFSALGDKDNLARTCLGLGESFSHRGMYDQASKEYNEAISLFEFIGDYKSLADVYYKAGTNYKMVDDYHNALNYFQKAAENYQDINDSYGLHITKNSLGIIYFYLGNYTEALKVWTEYENAMRELGDSHRLIAALNNKGLIYNKWAEYDEALEVFTEALELSEKSGNKSNIAGIYNSMGNLFHYSGNIEKSFEYYRKSIGLGEELDSKQAISIGLHNIGELHLKLGNTDSALYYVQKSLLIENSINNKLGIAETKATLGMVYFTLKKHRLAFSFFEQAEEVFNDVENISGLADIYQKYGQVYADIGNDTLALYYLNKSTEIASEIDLKKMQLDNHLFLAEYYEKENKFENALFHTNLYHQINDSVFNKIALDKTHYLTITLEKEEKDRELVELQRIQDEINYQNNIRNYINYFVSLLFIVLALSFYLRYAANKRSTVRLNEQYQVVLESEEKIKALIDASHDIVLLVDIGGTIVSANSQAEIILRNGNKLVGYDFKKIAFPLFQNQFDTHITRVLNLRKSHGFSLVSKEKLTFEITINPVFKSETEVSGLAIYMQDVTEILAAHEEKKKLEEQLFQIQKLESVGTMAGGIAHDFNNYLGTILGYSSMGYDDSDEGTAIKRYFKQITTASKSAQHTIQKLLTFSRNYESKKVIRVNLVYVAKETVEMIESTRPKGINFVTDYSSDSIEILGNAVEMQQVFINLFNNAFHALEGAKQGNLECRVSNSIFKDSHRSFLNNFNNNIASFCVSDDGMGMTEQVLNRIYEPFFTTKSVGSGTGLGLSVVHGIIKNHQGELIVESKLGKGTTFYIYLPAIS
jgi:PAS domain S-box-containing protein